VNQIKEKFPFVVCHECMECVLRVKKDANWNDVVSCRKDKECVEAWKKEMETK
jgi:hypothetical protein